MFINNWKKISCLKQVYSKKKISRKKKKKNPTFLNEDDLVSNLYFQCLFYSAVSQ